MDRVMLPFYYNLGAALGRLNAIPFVATPGTPSEERYTLWNLGNSVHTLLLTLYGVGAPLSAPRVAHDFLAALNTYTDQLFPPQGSTPTPQSEASARSNLLTQSMDLQAVVLADLQRLPVYSVPKVGIYQTDDLIDQAEYDLPEESRLKLSEVALTEVRESGRCLAYGVPTACGFHMMRAVEDVLRNYCDVVKMTSASTGKEIKLPDRPKNWGDYTAYLKNCTEPDVVETLALLQPLKNNERDVLAHPEKVLTPNEAFRLFQEGQTAIKRMAEKLPPRIEVPLPELDEAEPIT